MLIQENLRLACYVPIRKHYRFLSQCTQYLNFLKKTLSDVQGHVVNETTGLYLNVLSRRPHFTYCSALGTFKVNLVGP